MRTALLYIAQKPKRSRHTTNGALKRKRCNRTSRVALKNQADVSRMLDLAELAPTLLPFPRSRPHECRRTMHLVEVK